jgi:polyisoprenoid-binding protein YceI
MGRPPMGRRFHSRYEKEITTMAWQLDPAHTQVEFSAKHMMITTVRGRFGEFSAVAELDESDLTKSTVEFTIQTASLDTRQEQRDAHLRSPEFFDVENYPTITFKSTSVKSLGRDRYEVTGDLTVKGVTKPETFEVTSEGHAKDPWGKEHHGFTVTGKIDRKDFGLNWNVALETGGWLVGDDIKIAMDVELIKVDAPVAAAIA